MTVFIVQNQHHKKDGKLVPKFNFTTAEDFGKIEYLLSPTARPFSSVHVVAELNRKLAKFSDEDYLLLIGNPALIGFAVAIAAQWNQGRVKVLQWDGVRREYISIVARLKP